MPVELVMDEYDRIDVPLPDDLLESWRAQLDRAVLMRDACSLNQRSAASAGEGLAECFDWGLQPPTDKQLRCATAMAKERNIPLSCGALRYRGSMTEFLNRFTDTYKARRGRGSYQAWCRTASTRRPIGHTAARPAVMHALHATTREMKMTAADVLEWLIEASTRSSAVEPALFRALLDTTIYVHVPVSPKAEGWRFAMFKSSDDGTDVLSAFTDKPKARRAAKGSVHIVAVDGRTFFELVRGATVTINPNDTGCVLYPEEISRLLDGRTISSVQMHEIREEDGAQIFEPHSVPTLLLRALNAALRDIGGVEAAYFAGARWAGSSQFDGVLIALAGENAPGDRHVRAVAMALDGAMCDFHMPVAVIQFAVGAPPAWIKRLNLKPIWSDGVPETDGRRLRNGVAGSLLRGKS